MTTHAREIYDLFLQQVSDYRLEVLFETSEEDFENFLEAWLIFSYSEFSNLDIDFDFDTDTGVFSRKLNLQEKSILATLMMRYWLQKLVNDVTQINLHIADRDFRVASEAMNLREKTVYLNTVKEQCSQMLSDYSYRKNDWESWNNQNFGGW